MNSLLNNHSEESEENAEPNGHNGNEEDFFSGNVGTGGDDGGSYNVDNWTSLPYKQEKLHTQVYGRYAPGKDRHMTTIRCLQDMGVRVTVLDASVLTTADEVLYHARAVVATLGEQYKHTKQQNQQPQRCLLFSDQGGRLFNLVLPSHTYTGSNSAAQWEHSLDSFSRVAAIGLFSLLCRSLPCATQGEYLQHQGYGVASSNMILFELAIILGLVFHEEMSYSWLHSSMLVRGTPSLSGHYLFSSGKSLGGVGPSDVIRKTLLLILILAGGMGTVTAPSSAFVTAQKWMALCGILGTCVVLLANLGSRTWRFLNLRPLQPNMGSTGLSAFISILVSYLAAIGMGFALPFLGHRSAQAASGGGKSAIESVIRSAFWVAVIFFVSSIDGVRQFVVIGGDECNQYWVTIAVGSWWILTLCLCLWFAWIMPKRDPITPDGELLLQSSHASPVGYKVPCLPDFEIDPMLARTGIRWLSIHFEMAVGVLMALSIGGGIICLSFLD